MPLNMNDPAVQAAIIGALGSVFAAAIAATCAAIVGHQIAGRRRLQDNLQFAIADIQFLLEVEKHHCSAQMTHAGASMKNTIRKRATESGLQWSGRFTPARSAALADSLNIGG